jgi:hypothetical protein
MWKNRMLIKDLKNRSFPFGEGDGGWGLIVGMMLTS